jgi:type IV pilus assembly protein PilX
MNSRAASMTHARGFALFTALLLLMIITILAMSMFRAFGTQEHIAGNVREKERAFHAAESVQQYGEWWLLQGNNSAIGAQACAAGIINGNTPNAGQICTTTLVQNGQTVTAPGTWASATTYLPAGMSVTPGVNGTNGDPPYAAMPGFYIADVGPAADTQGEAYQIDSYGYGGSLATVAVVESVYEVQQGVVCRSCNP